MRLQQPFNPNEHDPTQKVFGGLPVGKHPVVITTASLEPTQDGQSGMVVFELECIDGPAKGSTCPYRLNLYNKNEKTARIAHGQLSALCHVTRQFQLGADGTDLSVLFRVPFVVEVALQKGEEAAEKGYTEVKKVFDMSGAEPGKAPPQQQQQQQQSNAQGGGWGANQGGSAGAAQGGNPAASGGGGWGGGGSNAASGGGAPAAGGWGNPGTGNNEQANANPGANTGGGWSQGQGGNGGGTGGAAPWGQR